MYIHIRIYIYIFMYIYIVHVRFYETNLFVVPLSLFRRERRESLFLFGNAIRPKEGRT